MQVAFRVDASLQMGSGHVMRCLTLADALKAQGADCHFISREHPGHLLELIRRRGHKVNRLLAPVVPSQTAIKSISKEKLIPKQESMHAAWLGCTWQTDVQETTAILSTLRPDWLVVDHYALDQRWEEALAQHYRKLLVIDDLADRPHRCDMLLDQNWFGEETPQRYHLLVPSHCKCQLGPEYALLQPEYTQLRESMPPRDGTVRRVLVFLGGSDATNQTSKALMALMEPNFAHLQVDVVISQSHPDIASVAAQVANRQGTTLYQDLPTLAPLMVRADLMISAGGSTTWERMCVGLPAIVISVAVNQTPTNLALVGAGYIVFLGEKNEVSKTDIANAVARCLESPADLKAQSRICQKLVPGDGAQIIAQRLLQGGEVLYAT
jgi:UDP-2,4-diacetamido-2,4,6-trideoxy-beta-L-altropyranose hydrolase